MINKEEIDCDLVFSPVIIPTLNRIEHFKKCIESLARCKHANKTELIIGLDYPSAEKYIMGYNSIKQYINNISGFKKVTVIYREYNFGAYKNWVDLMNYGFIHYDSIIMTEDDNEFSPNFLEYMNEGLRLYKNNPKIFSINGYNYPISMNGYDKNIYGSYRFSAWGCGFWKHKMFNVTNRELVLFVLNPIHFFKLLYRLPFKVIAIPKTLILSPSEVHLDMVYETYCCINNWISIFPTVSKVRNWGRDGSGLHGEIKKEKDPCYNQPIDLESSFKYDIIEDKVLKWEPLQKYFHTPLKWYFVKIFELAKKVIIKNKIDQK